MDQTIGNSGIQAEVSVNENKKINGRRGIQAGVSVNKNEEIKGEVTMKKNNAGLEFEVIGEKVKNGRIYCLVLFTESGSVRWARKDHVSEGSVKDLHHLSVCGIGGSGFLSHNGEVMSIDTAFDSFEKKQTEKARTTIEELWETEPEDWISTIIFDSISEAKVIAKKLGFTDPTSHALIDVSPEVAELLKKKKGILQENVILQLYSLVEDVSFLRTDADGTKIFVYDVPGQLQKIKDLEPETNKLYFKIEEIFKQMIEAHEEHDILKATDLLLKYTGTTDILFSMLAGIKGLGAVEIELWHTLDDLLKESQVC